MELTRRHFLATAGAVAAAIALSGCGKKDGGESSENISTYDIIVVGSGLAGCSAAAAAAEEGARVALVDVASEIGSLYSTSGVN